MAGTIRLKHKSDSVLDCLIYALGKYACTEAQKERRSQMFAEIVAHKQELTDSIQKVSWEFEDENHGEFKPEGPRLRRFTYAVALAGRAPMKNALRMRNEIQNH